MVWKPRVTVAAVIEHEGRYLLVEEDVGRRETVFNQPAGHLEEGESLVEAVIRETFEETGYPFEPTAVSGIYRWIEPDSGETYLRICFTGRVGERNLTQPLDEGIIGPRWFGLFELEKWGNRLRSPLVRQSISDHIAGRFAPVGIVKDVGDF